MAERIKDAEDRLLESLFDSKPVADDGFSVAVVRKVNRRLWVRRFTLPIAVTIGGAIAFKPLAGLVTALSSLSTLIPQSTFSVATSSIPQLQIVVLGAALLAVALTGMRILED